ncbi:MAG: hypothetical protein ACXQTD_09615 [Candidatus Syntropharchaeia archaeon]
MTRTKPETKPEPRGSQEPRDSREHMVMLLREIQARRLLLGKGRQGLFEIGVELCEKELKKLRREEA